MESFISKLNFKILQNSGQIFGLERKSTKSRDIWSNKKFGLGVQSEAGQRLTEFCQENTLVTENTLFQQHKR